jgi:inorganic pyrophosphatase
MDDAFWQRLDALVRAARLVIDRPKGSAHPRYADFIYPYDYGYLEGTTAADGGGIDAWTGSLPDRAVTGIIVTVDTLKRDAEIKILLGCTPAEAQEILARHNSFSQAGFLILIP